MGLRLIDTMDYAASFPEVVSSSTIGAYQSCPRQFMYSHILNLKPKATNIHLNAGGALASALNVFRHNFYGTHSLYKGDIDSSLALALEDLIKYFGEHVGTASPSEWDTLDLLPKGLPNLVVCLVAYIETFNPFDPHALHPYVDEEGKVWAEQNFAIPTQVMHPETGMPLLYSGRTDWIGVHNGYLYVMDEKTTGQMGAKWSNQWNLRGQFIGYTLGFGASMPNLAGTWVRGICLLKDTIKMAEHPVGVGRWLIREWWQDMNYLLEDMVRDWKRSHFRADRNKSCTGYSGCTYMTLCSKPAEHRKSFSVPVFDVAKYDPMTGEDAPVGDL